jgi:hypothetical protein
MPSRDRIDRTVRLVADLLGERTCWLFRGAYHFRLHGDATLAVSADDAGRFRLEACRATVPGSTVWVLDGDDARLAQIVSEMVEDAVPA